MPESSSPASRRRRWLGALVALLALATAAATYLQGALSVLSSYIVAEFELTPSEFGLAFTVFSLTGGVGSPLAGRIVDSSPRRVMAGLFAASTLAIVLVAGAPGYPWVLGAAVCGGLAVAAANPVTNKLVSQETPVARHGMVIGLKQAGPPMGIFAAGLLLPPAATVLGWRWALVATAVLPLMGFVATWVLVPDRLSQVGRSQLGAERRRHGRVTVWWLTVIGFIRAVGGGSVVAFVPLYAHEELGFSPAAAGLLAAVAGLTGVLGRLFWGARAARFRDPTVLLSLLAALALVSSSFIWAASMVPGLIVIGVVGAGFSILAWLAVSWFALLLAVDTSDVGRSTGVIQLATSIGVATGPLVVGLLVDSTGSFGWGWGLVTASFAVTLGLTLLWRRAVRVGSGSSATK